MGWVIKKQFLNNKSLNNKIDYSITNTFVILKGVHFIKKWDINEIKRIKQFKEAFWLKMNSNEELFIPTSKLETSELKDLINILNKTKT
ncbi:MAG: hypothetical protein R2836_07450 [Chitinophagales bacterium]